MGGVSIAHHQNDERMNLEAISNYADVSYYYFFYLFLKFYFIVIRFVSISAKFGICTVVDLNGTLVKAKNMHIQVSQVRI